VLPTGWPTAQVRQLGPKVGSPKVPVDGFVRNFASLEARLPDLINSDNCFLQSAGVKLAPPLLI